VIRAEPESWAALVDAAKPVIDYLFDAVVARHDVSMPRERSAVSAELLPMIAVIGDRVVQSHYLQQLARIVQTDEATLRLDMRQPARKQARTDAIETPQRANGARDKKEEFCLALLFRYPELLTEGLAIDAELFGYSENRALFETWAGWAERGGPESFEGLLTPDTRPQYERILNISLPVYDDDALVKALRSTVWSIEQQRLRFAKRASSAIVSQVTRGTDGEDLAARARAAREHDEQQDDEADPAAAVIDDMQAGLKVHQRLLEQRRGSPHAAGEVVNDG
jgi:hypothetical protein